MDSGFDALLRRAFDAGADSIRCTYPGLSLDSPGQDQVFDDFRRSMVAEPDAEEGK